MNRRERPGHGRSVLVTGASSGIGYELAMLFARDGHDLVLVARNKPRLMQLADELQDRWGVSVKVVVKDLSEPSAPGEIFGELQDERIGIDVLVNDAGFGTYGLFSESDLPSQLEMVQVNIASLTHLTRLFLGEMLRNGNGKILNVASTAAFQPGPLMAVYYATKAYVLSFSEALANELKGSGVTVTVLCPGPTRTEFHQRANMEDSRLVRGQVLRYMDAETVAAAGYRGLVSGKTLVIPGLRNKLGVFAVRLSPRSLVPRTVRWMQE